MISKHYRISKKCIIFYCLLHIVVVLQTDVFLTVAIDFFGTHLPAFAYTERSALSDGHTMAGNPLLPSNISSSRSDAEDPSTCHRSASTSCCLEDSSIIFIHFIYRMLLKKCTIECKYNIDYNK